MVTVSSAALFSRSAECFLELLGKIPDDRWESPGLGNWSVRSLAGHTARAILTVESYLDQEEPGSVTIESAEAYYSTVYLQFTDAAAVEARGVVAGVWLRYRPRSPARDRASNRSRRIVSSVSGGWASISPTTFGPA
jgi:hypothetical protein